MYHWRHDALWWKAICIGSLISLCIGFFVKGLIAPATPTPTNFTQHTFLYWPLLILLFPLLEEFVFRGLVQPTIARHWQKKIGQITSANLLTSLLFALSHLASKGVDWLTLGVFFPSLLFGFFRDRHQSWHSAMILHVSFNVSFFMPQFFA